MPSNSRTDAESRFSWPRDRPGKRRPSSGEISKWDNPAGRQGDVDGTAGKNKAGRHARCAERDLAGAAQGLARAAEEDRAAPRARADRAGLRQRGADLRGDLAPAQYSLYQPEVLQLQQRPGAPAARNPGTALPR